VLNKIIISNTWHELKTVFIELINKIIAFGQRNSQVNNLIVKKCLKIIDDHYKDITLTKIAAMLHITPEYVSTVFNRELDINFIIYIKKYRLNKAKELLVSTNLKTYEIAEKVGFHDPKYFSKIFKDLTGFSPVQYHNIYKK
jgi:two-component system response regulator YesN